MNVPLSLKMSATWENEKLSSSIVPRICTLNITQVIFDRGLDDMADGNHNSFYVSVRMRDNTRRVLRSPELIFPITVPGAVYLDFTCNIQYSHALKRESCNYLQLLIQRRKKYKKKAVNLGYKTLAYCTIDLAQVLQRKLENKFLDLYDDAKSMSNIIGRIEIKCLNTIAAEKDIVLDRRKDIFEEEDEGMHDQFSEPDDSDRPEDSDYDPNCGDFGEPSSRQKKIMKAMSVGVSDHRGRRRSSSPSTTLPEWQKQIKQKIMGLLKKVKLMEHSEELDPRDTRQLWEEIDQLDNVSEDSDIGDMDSLSIQSTPRPVLRPFFGLSGLPNQSGVYNAEDTIQADAGAKLLKKLQLETSLAGPYAFSNINFTDNTQMTAEKVKNNDGSETTEDESRSFTIVKKNSYNVEKDNVNQSSTNKSKVKSKSSVTSVINNLNKKDQQKPKKQISGIMKSFSLSTSPSTLPCPSAMTTTSQRSVLADSNAMSVTNEGISVTGLFATSLGSSVMTSSIILGPVSSESVKENTNSDMKVPNEVNPRLELIEQVNQLLDDKGDGPDIIYIINLSDYGGKYVSEMFHKEQVSHIAVSSFADSKFAMIQILNRMRKRSEANNKICLLGSDCHLNNILRIFVDQINLNYSKEIVNCFRFFLIPITGFSLSGSLSSSNQFVTQGTIVYNSMARRLCSVDAKYSSLFSEFIHVENLSSSDSMIERDNKFLFGVHDYLQAEGTLHCPIGDCLVACSIKSQNLTQEFDSSAESFIPFLCEVRLGEVSDVVYNKAEGSIDDQLQTTTNSSPPKSPIIGILDSSSKISQTILPPGTINTPINSQTTAFPSLSNPSSLTFTNAPDTTSLELQLEYWTDHSSKKVTLKSAFRQVLVSPTMVTAAGTTAQHSLSLTLISKEKKQKIMRITKKTKHEAGDSKKETFDDIIRILCTSKSQNSLIRVTIDGVMWTGVKFFQLNPYWRTQIKTFPIATFNHCS